MKIFGTLSITKHIRIFSYDEINITDHPGSLKVIVLRAGKQAKRIREHSKRFREMAAGILMPSAAVCRTKILYKIRPKEVLYTITVNRNGLMRIYLNSFFHCCYRSLLIIWHHTFYQ